MKKNSFKKLALLGIASGILHTSMGHAKTTQAASSNTKEEYSQDLDPNAGNLGYHLMSEDELLLELNDAGRKLYLSLDPEGKDLARKVASQRCDHSNNCSGLNSCQTDKNECAGKGSCKGQGKCGIADKNLAVKLAADKMAKKRLQSSR